MFFILSKVLLIFIFPLTWIIAFLTVALATKKKTLKRRSLITASVLLLIFSNPFLFDNFANLWDIKPAPLKKSQYSCAIVLGGFSGERTKGVGIFNGAADRFIQGVRLFDLGKVSHILISGGNGSLVQDGFQEGDWVYTQLKQFNVPDSNIVVENRSRNTIENAAFSKIILQKKHLQPPYILVTSAFHMRRSLGIFKKAGIDVIPYPCNYTAGNGHFVLSEFLPDADVLGKWNIYIKELVGSFVNLFK